MGIAVKPRPQKKTGAISTKIEGLGELQKWLDELPKKVRKRVIIKAVRAGGQETLQKLRAGAPRGATGLFKRSLNKKEKIYSSGAVVAVIGQRRRSAFSQKTKDVAMRRAKGRGGISSRGEAAPIALVNNPTKAHTVKPEPLVGKGLYQRLAQAIRSLVGKQKRGVLAWKQKGRRKWTFAKVVHHPGTKGARFMNRQGDQMKVVEGTVRRKLEVEIDSELMKQLPKGPK